MPIHHSLFDSCLYFDMFIHVLFVIVTSLAKEVMFLVALVIVCLSVCLFVCGQHYSKN